MKILLNEKRYELKAGTKTVFKLIEEETREITEEHYDNFVSSAWAVVSTWSGVIPHAVIAL